MLSRANLKVGRVRHPETGTTVTQQSPLPGRKVKCGASVKFTIGAIGE